MVYKNILLLTAFLCSAVMAEAQDVHGVVRAQGGLGTAQNKSDVTLFCALPGIDIDPYVGIAGVDKEKWNLTSDRTFLPVNNDAPYRSSHDVEYDGHNFYYGANFKTRFSAKHKITGSFAGSNTRMEGTGTFDEMFYYGSQLSHTYKHLLDLPSHDADLYKGDICYTYFTDRKGEKIEAKYLYYSLSTAEAQNEINTTTSFPELIDVLNFDQDTKELKHNALVNWTRPMGAGHFLNAGFEYENRCLTGNSHHDYATYVKDAYGPVYDYGNYNLGIEWESKTYIYRMGYDYREGALTGFVHADYHHTVLPFVTLDDVVPSARLQWKPNNANTFALAYVQRIIRPDYARLNPFTRITAYREYSIGNPELRGMHVNNTSLSYQHKKGDFDVNAKLSNIFCNDGFNALWYEGRKQNSTVNARYFEWGNNGKRRAWTFEPELQWKSDMKKIYAKGQIIWDKRIADAIGMAYEHWGVTAEVGGTYPLLDDGTLFINGHARYSEGNTLDLYSHEGRSMKLGGDVQYYLGKFGFNLAYNYTEYARTLIRQGVSIPNAGFYGWTGSEYHRPKSRHNLTATVSYSF